MDSLEVLLPLIDHLSIGDIFRLRRALGHAAVWTVDVERVLSQRMGLQRCYTMAQLSERMYNGRCVECGVPCRSVPRVCGECMRDVRCPVAMVTRAYIYDRYRGHKIRKLRERIREMRVVKRGRMGTYWYWKADADRLW